jgi:type II secretory pathway pseudopilin PulG
LKAITLVELIIVITIVVILATVAFPNFFKSKARAIDKEAIVSLRLIQAAEKIYRMEKGFYYPDTGSADVAGINSYLKLSLPSTNWTYSIIQGGSVATAQAQGSKGEKGIGYWQLEIDESDPDFHPIL